MIIRRKKSRERKKEEGVDVREETGVTQAVTLYHS